MNNDYRCINEKCTREKLERELKRDVILDREFSDVENYCKITDVMHRIEYMRSEYQKVCPEFTQKKLAEKAGIGHSTYTDYLCGTSDNIKLKTIINIAHALRCKLSDLIDG